MCYHRIYRGLIPGCLEACGAGALTFGKRNQLLKIARERIGGEPGRYIDHIYGEHEVGGTDWLYISGVSFEALGFATGVGTTAYPELTRDFLSMVPLVITVWPALFGGIYTWTRQRMRGVAAEAISPESQEAQR